MIDLSGYWSLFDAEGGHACAMAVPGDALSALVAAGHLPEPYVGRNEYDCRWPADQDWIAHRHFTTETDALDLVVSGLDTVAELRINGGPVLASANSFRRYRVDVSDKVRAGENRIEILFRSSPQTADARAAALPYPVPNSKNCPIANGNLPRKPACDFGWDWNIALAPFGLYGEIRLEPRREARVAGITVTQDHGRDRVDVEVSVHVEGAGEAREVSVSLCGQTIVAPVSAGRARAIVQIADPALWWPAGLGPQTLHTLTVTLSDQTDTRRIGLRTLEHVVEPDEAGAGFRFRVNGHDAFARGANWIPADALWSRITKAGTRALLQSAVDANMNMIRVWGGGRYEADWFYDLCDELGLMVWQDFMFACNLYPASDEFLAEVDAEVHDQVLRLNTHACIALWCGDNELVGALTWYEESLANRDRYLVAYDRLNRVIEAGLKEVLPNANWWPSSPASGRLDFGDAWHDDRSGDMHFWSVWHEGRDFEHYRDVRPRFCSEFGFQSFPSMPVIRTFAEKEDWNIAAPVMESHQKNAGGNARITETMFRYFRFPTDFESFVYLSQVQQGIAIRTAIDYWRSQKPHCMGALYWQLNDTWPVASWSSLDHGGGWKLLHHMARRFFAPVYVAAVPQGDEITFAAVNDTRTPVELSLVTRAAGMDGRTREIAACEGSVGTALPSVLTTLPAGSLAADEILHFEWTASDGSTGGEHLALAPYKALALAAPGIALECRPAGDEWLLSLQAASTALFVAVEANVPGRFSDNALTLLPDRPREIAFRPRDRDTAPAFSVRDLFAATHGSTGPT